MSHQAEAFVLSSLSGLSQAGRSLQRAGESSSDNMPESPSRLLTEEKPQSHKLLSAPKHRYVSLRGTSETPPDFNTALKDREAVYHRVYETAHGTSWESLASSTSLGRAGQGLQVLLSLPFSVPTLQRKVLTRDAIQINLLLAMEHVTKEDAELHDKYANERNRGL